MTSSCPPYYSSAALCLVRSHHVLLFRLEASDCLFLFGRAWSLCPPFSRSLFLHAARTLSSSSSVLLFCSHSVCSSLRYEASSIWYWEAQLRLSHQGTQTRLRLSHQGTQTKFCVLVCVRGRGENYSFQQFSLWTSKHLVSDLHLARASVSV